MSNGKLTKVLHCKKALIEGYTKITLQQKLASVLLERKSAESQSEPVDKDGAGKTFRVIAQYTGFNGGLAGIFTIYERGTSAVSVLEDPAALQITLQQLAPPKTSDGKMRQWAEGLLYFFVRGNFVVLIQSSAVRSGQFEEHLSWLFREPGAHVGPGVSLYDQPPADVKKRIAKAHVKSVSIGGDLLRSGQLGQSSGDRKTESFHLNGPLLCAVTGALGDSSGFDWKSALNGNLEARLLISYNRKTDEQGQKLLDSIAVALRNTDEVDTTIELNGGGEIKGSELKLMTKSSIAATDGVLNPDQAYVAMHSWVTKLMAETLISV